MTAYEVVVDVMLKPEILDPAGQAVSNALPHLGFAVPAGLRIGKHVELLLDADDDAHALQQATTTRTSPTTPWSRPSAQSLPRSCAG